MRHASEVRSWSRRELGIEISIWMRASRNPCIRCDIVIVLSVVLWLWRPYVGLCWAS